MIAYRGEIPNSYKRLCRFRAPRFSKMSPRRFAPKLIKKFQPFSGDEKYGSPTNISRKVSQNSADSLRPSVSWLVDKISRPIEFSRLRRPVAVPHFRYQRFNFRHREVPDAGSAILGPVGRRRSIFGPREAPSVFRTPAYCSP